MKVLASDLGGTNARFIVADVETGKVSELISLTLNCSDFESFDAVLDAFLDKAGTLVSGIAGVCIAVAGPVESGYAKVTNLPWELDGERLSAKLKMPVFLINDFEAIGWGLEGLTEDALYRLQPGSPSPRGNRALVGAGTGLGQALLSWGDGFYNVHATEGGHTDFAPQDPLQIALLEYLQRKYEHVSYERLLSGAGLVTIFKFLLEYKGLDSPFTLAERDAAATISNAALEASDSIAVEALDLFVSIYGAQAGNLALTVMPRGGLFIAGGIAAKILPRMTAGGFMRGFLHKGRMREVIEKIPVHIVLDPSIGLRGAALAAGHLATG